MYQKFRNFVGSSSFSRTSKPLSSGKTCFANRQVSWGSSRSTNGITAPSCYQPALSYRNWHSTRSLLGAVIGIDLGTTNSCLAVIDPETNQPKVLENDGKRTTPSIFAITSDGQRLVGYPAQRQMVVNPQDTFYATKRLIGRRFEDRETKIIMKNFPFSVVPGPNGDAWVQSSDGKKYSPSQMASNTLMKLKSVAEDALGTEVDRAVITVPAYFDNHQRQATEDAGKIAGLKVERIINEPTAAALAYGISRDEDRTIVVYDLGGGTFDVSILQLGDGVFEVKSTAGDTFLDCVVNISQGGEDFNNVLTDYIITQYKKKTGKNLKNDQVAFQRIREAAEIAKHELSTKTTAEVNLPYITVDEKGKPMNLNMEITRDKFEEISRKLVESSIAPCKEALEAADLTVDDVTDVILVGGQTRMPAVREAVKRYFKQEPFAGVNPDEAVAMGAALQGSIITNKGLVLGKDENENKELILLDVTPLNLGIGLHDGSLATIIPAQTTIPCKMSHTFTTAENMQTEVKTEVYQGNRPIAGENRLLGTYTVSGIMPAPAGVPQIEVSFSCSANGMITATSKDKATNKETSMTINMSGGLSDAEVERMRLEAQQNEAADKEFQASLKIYDEARTTIRKVEENLGNITGQDTKEVGSDIQKLKSAVDKKESTSTVEKLKKKLEVSSGKVFTDAYRAQASQATPSEE